MKETEMKSWSRKRIIHYLLSHHRDYNRLKGDLQVIYRALKCRAARITEKSMIEIFPGVEKCDIKLMYSPRLGGGDIADVVSLSQISKFLRRRRIFEIGTFCGYTTYHIALNTSDDTHVYTLDLPADKLANAKLEITDIELIKKPIKGEWFLNTKVSAKITQLLGDSAAFDYSEYEGRMDLVYVDGGHSYEYAMEDSMTARKLLTRDGIIVWHDYPTWPGVWCCLEDLQQQWPGHFAWIKGTALVLWHM